MICPVGVAGEMSAKRGGEDGFTGSNMENDPRAAGERATKIQEVILRAMAKKINWFRTLHGYAAGLHVSPAA